MRRVCVFSGSKTGTAPAYVEAARALAASLVRRGLGLVYGGGNIGLMGVLADAVLAGGSEVIGVIPRFMVPKELAHPGLTKLLLVESMHERKALMAEHADAFLALPGGFGTADERSRFSPGASCTCTIARSVCSMSLGFSTPSSPGST